MDGWMDRWMDGWTDGRTDGEDLIICVALWTLYKRRPPLLSDDLRAICIASRNRLRSASLCGAIFRDFGAIFGSFGSYTQTPKSIFGSFFAMFLFECVLASIFCRFLGTPP